VRLQMDVDAALARLHAAQGATDDAQRHSARAGAMALAIESSLVSSGLRAQLRRSDGLRGAPDEAIA
jgi:hypothetical protein